MRGDSAQSDSLMLEGLSQAELSVHSRIVLPPTFCQWRALLGVSAVSLLSATLVALGQPGWPEIRGMGIFVVYGQLLGAFCAVSVCIGRAWLRRLATREAWLGAWFIVVVATIAFSYAAAVVGTVLGFGPGREQLVVFMLKSVLATGIVAAALLRYLFIRAQWQAEMLAEADARVQALQARIRPHFLFNSLNTIASLIHDDPESAERATEDLAELFRGGMRRSDQLIPLTEEIDLARKYLHMEQRRLGDRLQVEWSLEGLPESASVLPMILQPLLENAIGHGIQSRPEGGVIQVFGRAEGDNIVITITNPLSLPPDSRQGLGMALRNIRSRLALAFAGRATLITNEDGDRFYAVLTLPHVEHSDR